MSSKSSSTKWTVERAMEEKTPILHPMGGCDLNTLLTHFHNNRNFSLRSLKQRISSTLAVAVRQPFSIMESLNYRDEVENYEMPQDPIFIIGHWRSGTTHLHNLLSHDPQFRFLDFGQTAMPHNILSKTNGLGRKLIARSLPKKRGYDNVELTVDSPQEEEMALGSLNALGYYCVYYFPQDMKWHFDRSVFFEGATDTEREDFKQAYRKLVRKLSIANKGAPLLFKNPPSSARIEVLRELFPNAKFIYIHRNPYEVYASSLNRYFRLMAVFAWQDFKNVDFEEMVFYKYRRLLQGYLEQSAKVPSSNLIETSYEAITANPLEEIERIYDSLKIDGKAGALEAISPYVESKKDYKRNVHQLKRSVVERIQSDWDFSLKKWPYEIPEGIEVVDG